MECLVKMYWGKGRSYWPHICHAWDCYCPSKTARKKKKLNFYYQPKQTARRTLEKVRSLSNVQITSEPHTVTSKLSFLSRVEIQTQACIQQLHRFAAENA